MSQGAKVTSISALREFRPSLIKFVEEARAALVAAEGECNRTIEWLRHDRSRHWKKEIRVRSEEIVRCKTDLLNKQRSATGDPRSAVEERKALDRAKMRLEEATRKQADTKRWLRQLEKELMQYKGMSQALSGELTRLEDRAIHDLDRMAEALEQYVAMQAPSLETMGEAPSPKGFAEAAGFGGGSGRSDATESAPPSPFAGYRRATPSAGKRRRAEAVESVDGPEHVLDRVSRQKQGDNLRALLMDDPPERGSTLSLSRDALEQDRIYLERCEPVDEQDSGWYLGAAPEGTPEADRRELRRVPLEEVVRLRPDLEAGLRLGRGALLVVEGGRIVAVTAPNDTIVYSGGDE